MTDMENTEGFAAQMEGEEGEEAAEAEPKYENLDAEMLEEVADVFDIFDKNKDETIEVSSLGTVLRWLKFNPTDTELDTWRQLYDPNQRGFVTLHNVKTIVN